MIDVHGLTKRYGSTLAVDDLAFDVPAGQVTGFLGPNGAGKSTTMQLIMGLDAPDAGQASIGGRRYGDLPWPLREVGAPPPPRSRSRPAGDTAPGSECTRGRSRSPPPGGPSSPPPGPAPPSAACPQHSLGPAMAPGCGLGVGGERLHYWVFDGPWSWSTSGGASPRSRLSSATA